MIISLEFDIIRGCISNCISEIFLCAAEYDLLILLNARRGGRTILRYSVFDNFLGIETIIQVNFARHSVI